DRTAHRCDAANLVHGRADHGEIQTILAANVAVEHITQMQSEIHVSDGKTFRSSALVYRRHGLASAKSSGKRRITSPTTILSRENGEHAIAYQFENITALSMNRRDYRPSIIVEKGNNVFRLRRIADSCVATEVAEPQYRLDPFGNTSRDAALQNTAAG